MSDPPNSTHGSLGKAEIAAGGRSPIAAPLGGTPVRPPSWIVLTSILLFVGHLPLLSLYAVGLMGREPYQFAPLAVAAALFLAWHRLRLSPEQVAPGSPRVAFAILAAAFSILCLATAMGSPWLAALSALVTALGVVWAVGGLALAVKLFPGALMLIILLRPPLGLQNSRVIAFVALDYPFAGFHNLTFCYRKQGWEANLKPVKTTDPTGKEIVFFEAEMGKKPRTSGYLLFGAFTETGQQVEPDPVDFTRLVQARFLASGKITPRTTTYQVQVLHSSYAPLSLAEKQQMLSLFTEARQLLVQQVLGQLKGKP